MARAVEDICNMALGYSGVNSRIQSLADRTPQAEACNTFYVQKRDLMLKKLRPSFALVRKILYPRAGAAYASGTTFALGQRCQYGNNLYRSLQNGNTGNQPNLVASAAWWVQETRDGYSYVYDLPTDCLSPVSAWELPDTNGVNVVVFDDLTTPNARLRAPRNDQRTPYAVENSDDGNDTRVILADLDTAVLKYIKQVVNPAAFTEEFVEALAWEMAPALINALRSDPDKGLKLESKVREARGEAWATDKRDQQEDPEPVSSYEAAREG